MIRAPSFDPNMAGGRCAGAGVGESAQPAVGSATGRYAFAGLRQRLGPKSASIAFDDPRRRSCACQ